MTKQSEQLDYCPDQGNVGLTVALWELGLGIQLDISKKEMALHTVRDLCVIWGGICVGSHLFGICLSNKFDFHWKPIFKVAYIDYLWAIIKTYACSSLLLATSKESMAADIFMIRKIHGDILFSLIHALGT